MWRVYLFAALIAGACGSLAAFVTVKLMAPEPRAENLPTPPPATRRLTGSDHLEFASGDVPSEKVIFYSAPFASPPHLTLTIGSEAGYMVTDQTEKSFKLQRGPCPVKGKEADWRIAGCTWNAEGLAAK